MSGEVLKVLNIDPSMCNITRGRWYSHFVVDCCTETRCISMYIVMTNRTLRRPRGVGINYDGEMVGIRRLALLDSLVHGRLIVFVVSSCIYCIEPGRAEKIAEELRSCINNGTEWICHIPLKELKVLKCIEKPTLMQFMR